MSYAALAECACGHVANHHSHAHGCHVTGCMCRRFNGRAVSIERHNEVIQEANRRIRKLQKRVKALEAQLPDSEGQG